MNSALNLGRRSAPFQWSCEQTEIADEEAQHICMYTHLHVFHRPCLFIFRSIAANVELHMYIEVYTV